MKRLLVVLLIFVPSLTQAAYIFPNGKAFEEQTKIYYTLSGVPVAITEWVEVPLNALKYLAEGFIPIAKASSFSLRDEIELWLRSYSETYDIPQLYDLAICESNLSPNVLGDKGKAKGLFQWWEKSWNYYNKKYKTNLDRNSWRDQLDMTVKVLQEPSGYENWLNCWSYIKYKTWNKKLWK